MTVQTITMNYEGSAARQDLAIEQGAAWYLTINVTPPADGAGWVLDDTVTAARLQARRNLASTTKLLDLVSGEGEAITITNNVDGTLTLEIFMGATDTDGLDWADNTISRDTAPSTYRDEAAVYDLEIVLASDNDQVHRVIEGAIKLSKEVTR